jgi:hypothetical protein
LPYGARTFLHVVRRSGCLADSQQQYTLPARYSPGFGGASASARS